MGADSTPFSREDREKENSKQPPHGHARAREGGTISPKKGEAMAELTKLYERVEKGIRWLSEHDPDSRFHLWYEAKITTTSLARAPRVTDEDREGFAAYVKQRDLWEKLWARMVTLEAATGTQSHDSLSRTRGNDNFTHTRGTLWQG